MKKKYILSASIVCADILNLGEQVKKLEEGGIDYLHIDVMDGLYVPRYGLMPEIVKQIRSITCLPMDVHMMVQNPEPYIKVFKEAGVNIISVHAEGNNNLHRTVKLIKDSGLKAGIILNMATPITILDYIKEDISLVMLMGINPGILGHKIIPQIYKKITDLRKYLKDYPDIIIEIDGGVTSETIPKMINAGANMFVCGSSTIFKPTELVKEKSIELRNIIDNELKD